MDAEIYYLSRAGFLRDILADIRKGITWRKQWLKLARQMAHERPIPAQEPPPAFEIDEPLLTPAFVREDFRHAFWIAGNVAEGQPNEGAYLAVCRRRGRTDYWRWSPSGGHHRCAVHFGAIQLAKMRRSARRGSQPAAWGERPGLDRVPQRARHCW